MEAYPCRPNDEVPCAEGIVPIHLPGDDGSLSYGPVRSGVPLKAAQGGVETMFPEYQDTMRNLPSNPPLSQIEKAEQKVVSEETGR